MVSSKKMILGLCLFGGISVFAHAQSNSRGELLYATHCGACHATEIHWRKQKLAADWDSLLTQVRQWQASIGQSWSDDEIMEVACYLNATHYGFPAPGCKSALQGKAPDHALR